MGVALAGHLRGPLGRDRTSELFRQFCHRSGDGDRRLKANLKLSVIRTVTGTRGNEIDVAVEGRCVFRITMRLLLT